MMGNVLQGFAEELASLEGNTNDPTRKLVTVASDGLKGQGTFANAGWTS